jgi:hypothetical protein
MAIQTSAPNATLLNASDFELGFATGTRVALTRHTRTGCDLEFTYFGIDSWNDTIVIADTLFLPLPGGNFFLGAAPVTLVYESQLHSVEMNVTSPQNDSLTLLAGFRWMELNERFDASSPGNPDVYAVESGNHLYGLQIGGIFTPIQTERFWVEAKVVGGAYHNNMLVKATIFDGNPRGRDQQHELAFVGELALTGIYQCTDRLALRAGYQLMLIDNVAVATDQITTHDVQPATIGVVNNGSLLYHGGFGGLEWTW